jgi:hypothetical protein
MFAQFDLESVKPYNVVFWIHQLLNFTIQCCFEAFLIAEYLGSSGQHARRKRLQKHVECLFVKRPTNAQESSGLLLIRCTFIPRHVSAYGCHPQWVSA